MHPDHATRSVGSLHTRSIVERSTTRIVDVPTADLGKLVPSLHYHGAVLTVSPTAPGFWCIEIERVKP